MANCLHLVFEPTGVENCLRCFSETDALVLMGNACICAIDRTLSLPKNCYVMADEFAARGLQLSSETIQQIDMSQLVELTEHHQKSVSWK